MIYYIDNYIIFYTSSHLILLPMDILHSYCIKTDKNPTEGAIKGSLMKT